MTRAWTWTNSSESGKEFQGKEGLIYKVGLYLRHVGGWPPTSNQAWRREKREGRRYGKASEQTKGK